MADINEPHRLGYEHGLQSGYVIERQAVERCWARWGAAEIEAYLEGRSEGAEGAQEKARAMAG